MTVLTTARLRLQPYAEAHLDGLHAMNSDPDVMRYITGCAETREQTLVSIGKVKARWAAFGYSWWSFIEGASGEIVGAGCIQNLRRQRDGEPDPACPLEIGWRLRRDKWHRGLAFEAAARMARFAFEDLHAELLCAVCDPRNIASRTLMERLGMRYRGVEHWYERDLATYAIAAPAWRIPSPLPRPRRAGEGIVS